ncbi:signal peptidase I [Oceanivirga miroungae]|uniref:Signal peptidase I n=1 Tax=Oceanivirga miroungae TaxID=1130046 RepID=A0A6I8M9G3_9FUSO|nr:signal peptidase I [Oceanivirga miroungae]VWL84934.1 type IV secretory pathway protease TraF-like protein [Oceanivirga miroungae]
MLKKLRNITIYIFLGLAIIFYKFRINVSNSVPVGIYYIINFDKEYKLEDYVVLKEPKEYKKYEPDNLKELLSLKKIKGVKGDIIEIKNSKVYINNKLINNIIYDIPVKIKGKYTLKDNEYFVLGENDTSLDSRYYGVINKKDIVYKAKSVWKYE